MKKYIMEWLKSFELNLTLSLREIHVVMLFLNIWIGRYDIGNWGLALSIGLPKYGFILTDSNKFFYRNSAYRFYKKKLYKNLAFYIMHIEGDCAKTIDGKEDNWSN